MSCQEIVLTVEGMSCGHCQKAVEEAVGGLAGVNKVSVDLAAKKVSIAYDPATVSLAAIKEAIEDAGYDVVD